MHKYPGRVSLAVLLSALVLAGCADESTPEPPQTEEIVQELPADWGLTPVFQYNVPRRHANIMIDYYGYDTKAVKTAILPAENAPDTFSLLDRTSGEIVYTDLVQKKNGTNFAVFSDFEKTGTYRLVCDELGQSYDFVISDDAFAERLSDAVATLWSHETDQFGLVFSRTPAGHGLDVEQSSRMMIRLLEAVELYPQALDTERNLETVMQTLAKQAQYLLTLQDAKTGEVTDADGKPASLEDTALYCGTLAKFGYQYRATDNQFATSCLKAADRAWKYLMANTIEDTTDELFFAAAELYRATNQNVYHRLICDFEEQIEQEIPSEVVFYGEMTYLCTRKGADKRLCASMMKRITGFTEQIVENAHSSAWLVDGQDAGQLLYHMEVLGFVNYVITNHEYDTVIANHIHYLMGRNENGEDYRDALYEDPVKLAALIYTLAAAV